MIHVIEKSLPGIWMPHGARRRFLFGLLGTLLLLLASPSAQAQQAGIGIFTEGEHYAEIYVPGKPGEIPSAPTIQAAIDMAKGPTFISVSLPESPGFLAEGKEVAIGLAGTTITTSMTFIDCPRAILIGYPNFTTEELIAFLKCQNILLQFGTTGPVVVEDSNYGHIHTNTINGGLFVKHSAGLSIGPDLFTHAAPSLIVSDCNDAPPASPPPLEWARYEMPYGRYPIAVGGCRFEKIGPPPLVPTAAALFSDARVLMGECQFEELEVRGVESHDCQDVRLRSNTFNHVNESAILFFNSEGLAELNKMSGIAPGDFASSTGIYVNTVGEKPPHRSNVRLEQNEIHDADQGIFASHSTINTSGNRISGGLFGIIAQAESDGAIVGDIFRGTRFDAIVVFQVAPGFLVQYTTMDAVQGYGLLIYDSRQVTVKDVDWRAQCDENCDRAENIRQPLVTGGIHIIASDVTLDYVRIGSQLTAAALLVEAAFVDRRSTVQCSQSSFNTYGECAGIIVDESTLTGGLSTWNEGRGLIAQYAAKVTLSGSEVYSDINGAKWGNDFITPLAIESGSQLELSQGRVTQIVPAAVTTDQIARAPDVVKISGASKVQMSGTGISGLGTLTHLTGGSNVVFENCELSGNSSDERGVISGPAAGLLVEDGDSMADVRNGKIVHQGGIGIRALFGGRVVANGLTINLAKTYLQVDAGGQIETDSCTFGENPSGLIGIRVNAGGEAVIRNGNIGYFFNYGVSVAAGGKCELVNCSIHNGNIGIQADPGATLAQSGTRFAEVTAETGGAVASGGGQ